MTTQQPPATHQLVTRLKSLRAKTRQILFLYGLGIVATLFISGGLLAILADYLVHLSLPLRMTLLVAGLLLNVFFIWRFLIHPLSQKLSDQFLASRVENVNTQLTDELMTAVSFLRHGLPEKSILAAKALESIEQHSANLPFEKALDYRLPGKFLAGAGILAAIVLGFVIFAPHHSGIAWQRWAMLNDTPWPRVTRVAFEWPDGKAPTVIPLGDRLVLKAKVTPANTNRVWIYYSSDANHSETRELMTPQASRGAGAFEKEIEPTGDKNFYLRIAAGDDTEQEPLNIKLAPRPLLTALSAQIIPPAYVKPTATTTPTSAGKSYDLLSEVGRAVEGSTVRLRIETSNPLLTNSAKEPEVALVDATKDTLLALPGLTRKLINPTTAEVSFPAAKSLDFRIQVRDSNGFDNRVAAVVRLDVVPDTLPLIVMTEPRRQLEVVPDAVIDVAIQGTDDLGLDEVILQADNYDAKAGEPNSQPRFKQTLTWGPQIADSASLSVTSQTAFTWALAGLQLKPGDRLSFYALARDNFAIPQSAFKGPLNDTYEVLTVDNTPIVRHRLMKSAALSLLVSSRDRIEDNYRKDLQEVRDQIRNLHGQQDLAKEQTRAIQKAIQDTQQTTAQQKQQLAELASQQSTLAQRAAAIQSRTDQIRDNMKTNRMTESDLGKLAQNVSEGMKDVGQNNMPKAASDLSKAQESASDKNQNQNNKAAEQTEKSTNNAARQQEMALNTMQKLIDQPGAAGDFEAHRSKLADILDRQKKLEKDLRDKAPKTIGKKPNELSPEDKNDLDKIAKEQDNLAKSTADLTNKMEKTSEQLSKTDPAASESLSKAAQASRQNNVAGAQSSASKSAGQNQTSSASNEMTNARKGLEEMMNELDQQNKRQLEQLARQLQDLLDAIEAIKAKQVAIKDDTVKAGAKAIAEVLSPLADRQGRLQGNTLAESKRAESLRDGRPVALDIHDAADAMGFSAVGLTKSSQPDSLPPQDKALASLDKALEKLKKQKKEIEEKLKDEDLAAIRKQYEAIKKGQEEIKTASDQIAQRKEARGELLRPDLLKLGEQATAQAKLSESIEKLSTHKELSKFDVIVFINAQILETMADSKRRLSSAQVGKELANAQQQTLDRLQEIIDALKEEQGRKSEFAGGGGGGGGGGGKPPLIPPVTQLKLLKSQQLIVNRTTTDTHKALETANTPAEKGQLQQQAEKLGEKQDKIKDLATKVVDQMKQP